MTTILGDKLNQAFEAKNNDVETFLWKGSRKIVDGERIQSSMKMVDMTEEELKKVKKLPKGVSREEYINLLEKFCKISDKFIT